MLGIDGGTVVVLRLDESASVQAVCILDNVRQSIAPRAKQMSPTFWKQSSCGVSHMSSQEPAITKVVVSFDQLDAVAFGEGQLVDASGNKVVNDEEYRSWTGFRVDSRPYSHLRPVCPRLRYTSTAELVPPIPCAKEQRYDRLIPIAAANALCCAKNSSTRTRQKVFSPTTLSIGRSGTNGWTMRG